MGSFLKAVILIFLPQVNASTGVLEVINLRSSISCMHCRISFTGYIGDYNGSPDMNELNMMKEIRARGPIIVGMVFPHYFHFYDKGILECGDILLPEIKFSEDQTEILRRIRDEFRLEEHLVMVLGWGETKRGIKYWIAQNSYFLCA